MDLLDLRIILIEAMSVLSGVLVLSITPNSLIMDCLPAQRRRTTAGPELDCAGGQRHTRRA